MTIHRIFTFILIISSTHKQGVILNLTISPYYQMEMDVDRVVKMGKILGSGQRSGSGHGNDLMDPQIEKVTLMGGL